MINIKLIPIPEIRVGSRADENRGVVKSCNKINVKARRRDWVKLKIAVEESEKELNRYMQVWVIPFSFQQK